MLKVGYQGTKHAWRGVLRDERGKVVWMTAQTYHNRDSRSLMHEAAQAVAFDVLDDIRRGVLQ